MICRARAIRVSLGHNDMPETIHTKYPHNIFFSSPYTALLFKPNLGWALQTNEPSKQWESTTCTVYRRNGRFRQIFQLYTNSSSCLSGHHFSDSGNSTKSMQYPCRVERCEVSELSSHIKNTTNQLGNKNYQIYTHMKGVREESGPQSSVELYTAS